MSETGLSIAVPDTIVMNPTHLFVKSRPGFPKQHKTGEDGCAVRCGSGVEKGEIACEIVGVWLCAVYK